MLIGEKLEYIRKRFNIQTQSEMAKTLGLEQGSYSDIVRGKTKKISGPLGRILEILYNVDIDSLSDESKGIDDLFKINREIAVNTHMVAEEHSPYLRTETKDQMEIRMLHEMVDSLRESNSLYRKQLEILEIQIEPTIKKRITKSA